MHTCNREGGSPASFRRLPERDIESEENRSLGRKYVHCEVPNLQWKTLQRPHFQ